MEFKEFKRMLTHCAKLLGGVSESCEFLHVVHGFLFIIFTIMPHQYIFFKWASEKLWTNTTILPNRLHTTLTSWINSRSHSTFLDATYSLFEIMQPTPNVLMCNWLFLILTDSRSIVTSLLTILWKNWRRIMRVLRSTVFRVDFNL